MKTYHTKIKIILLLIIICSFLYAAKEQRDYPKIKAIIKPKETTIGVPLEYRLNITGKSLKKIEIVLPQKKEFYPEKEVKRVKKKDDDEEEKPSREVPLYIIHNAQKKNTSEEQLESITIILKMSYYRPGKYSLPEIEIIGKDKIKIGYKIPEVVVKELNQKGELQDIEPPLSLGGNYYRLFFLLIGVSLLTALLIFLFKYIQKKREEKMNQPIIIPPINIFLDELKKLKVRSLIRDGMVEEYVFGISMIFRKFLSLLMDFDATEMTSEEVIEKLEKVLSRIHHDKYKDDIMKSFQMLDLAKFAEFTPSEEILVSNLDKIITLARNLSKDLYRDQSEDKHDISSGI